MKTDLGSKEAIRFQDAWVDISSQAADHGLSGRVHLSRAAWFAAVYFVHDLGDRLDPVRENWRLGRLLQEVAVATGARAGIPGCRYKLPVQLEDGFDRLRCLELPGAALLVRIDPAGAAPTIWIDVFRDTGYAEFEQALAA